MKRSTFFGTLVALFTAPFVKARVGTGAKVIGAVDVYPSEFGEIENLSDVIYDISPAETPLMGMREANQEQWLLDQIDWCIDN